MTRGRPAPAADDADRSGVPSQDNYRWVLLGAMCGVYFAFGVVLLAIPPNRRAARLAVGAEAGCGLVRVGPQDVGAFGDSHLGFPGALGGMAILLGVMVAVLRRDDRRSRRLASRSPSGPPTSTAGSTMCGTT